MYTLDMFLQQPPSVPPSRIYSITCI
jgi:hypothetical protein